MNLREIKIETLKLMFANDDNLKDTNFEDLTNNPNYADYLSKMNGSIARALQRIQTLKKAPCKLSSEMLAQERYGEYVLDLDLIEDCYKVDVVNKVSDKSIERNVAYDEIEDNFIKVESKGKYVVSYYPTLPRYKDSVDESTEVPLPEYIAVLIPLYVKSELLEQEEPSMSAKARNEFESSLEEINTNVNTIQRRIKRII